MADIQEIIDSVRTNLRDYLQEAYPDFVEFDNGTFTLQQGSAVVSVIIREWYENDVAVQFTSQLVSDASITPDLMEWLLRENAKLHFGAFGLLFDGTVVYSHSLPGKDLTRDEFVATARTVAVIADHYDSEIVAIAGGQLGSAAAAAMASEVGTA